MPNVPLDQIIEINSVGVKNTFSIGKLNTIIIEKYNKLLPQPKFVKTLDLSSTQLIFGNLSPVSKFAERYFGFTSKKASKASLLYIYNWNNENIPPVLKGGRAPSLSFLKTLNGKVKITIGTISQDISIDFTNINDFLQASNKIQEAITSADGQESNNGFTSAEVIYSVITEGFIIKGGNTGNGETIGYLQAPDDGIDIHNKLGLTLNEGASVLEGLNGKNSFSEVLKDIDIANDNCYLITPNFEFEEAELENNLKDFGIFLKNSNDRYAGLYSWSNRGLITLNSGITEPYKAYDGLILDYKVEDYQNGLVSAMVSAMELNKNSGNYNIAFNDANEFNIKAINNKLEYQALIENKVNSVTKFGVLGQEDTIYMPGMILGVKTDSINVYVCNSFLKLNLQITLYNVFKNYGLVGLRDKDAHGALLGTLSSVFDNAVNAKIIARGAKLTNTETQVIIDNFGSLVRDIDSVIKKIQDEGYFFTIRDINVDKKEITLINAYMANSAIRKVIINNYILGA